MSPSAPSDICRFISSARTAPIGTRLSEADIAAVQRALSSYTVQQGFAAISAAHRPGDSDHTEEDLITIKSGAGGATIFTGTEKVRAYVCFVTDSQFLRVRVCDGEAGYMRMYVYVYVHTYIHTYMSIRLWDDVRSEIHATYVCMYVYTYIHAVYIHAHIHAYIPVYCILVLRRTIVTIQLKHT